MISKRSLSLILCLTITGCNMDCVEPGLQSRNTSVNVDVPVHKTDEGIKIHWVDSGQIISKDEKIKFSLSGSVNFCPSKEGKNPRKVIVPASFCPNGSMPNYDKAKDVNDVPNNYGINEPELCGNGFGSNRRYVDTEIKVNPGDKLSFSLVPREMKIDYNKPKNVSFDDNCYRTEKETKNEKVVDINDLLIGGEFFCKGKDGIRQKVKFPSLDKTKIKKEDKVLVGNGYTPYDNKVHFNKNHISNEISWVNGALLDLRRAKIGLNELCDKERSKGGDWERRCGLDKMKKYSPYEINCYGQNICYNKSGIWNMRGRNCVSSIRYKKYDKGSTCDMYSYLKEMEGSIKSGTFTGDDDSWAEALIAKIAPSIDYENTRYSDRFDMTSDAEGTQCFPKERGANDDSVCSKISNNFKDFSLQLDHEYKVNENIGPGSSVMLAIASDSNYSLHRGGYHVQVTRSCNFDSGEKLYMYLGDEPPKDKSADTSDFKEVTNLRELKEDNVTYYVIDGSHLNEKESKKIHFGIDVSNVKKDEITDKDGKYYKDNKYAVNLFVKKKINDFISSTVDQILVFIKGKEGKEGLFSIKDSYEGYRKGLLQGVRALLTLYVIFTVVGYMLGTVQLSKFDFVVRITKIAFIAFAFSDQSWELFGTNLSKLFVNGSTYLVKSFSGYIGEGKDFAFLDLTVGVLFTGETWLKFLSLMLSGPFGFIAFLIILQSTATFLKCIISAIFKYVISTVLVAFLLSLTPLFIVFILFQQTKPLFDNWIKTLAHVGIQPVILFSSLSLLNQLMYSVLYNLTNFSACYQCLISTNFLSYDVCLLKSILPLGYSPSTSVDVALSDGGRTAGHFAALPIDLIQAFIYLIIANAMKVFVSTSETIAQAIFGAGYGIVNGVSKVASSASQAALSTVGLDNNTQDMIQRIKGASHKDKMSTEVKTKPPSESQPPDKSGRQKKSSKGIEQDKTRTPGDQKSTNKEPSKEDQEGKENQ